jgi:hypothetical protein
VRRLPCDADENDVELIECFSFEWTDAERAGDYETNENNETNEKRYAQRLYFISIGHSPSKGITPDPRFFFRLSRSFRLFRSLSLLFMSAYSIENDQRARQRLWSYPDLNERSVLDI